ncbi:MAG: hypothetical protein HY906_24525 [Deltaproteobacteria bacterium]|nr:hypothetical protein [Deltaproteobacteria bacterium]
MTEEGDGVVAGEVLSRDGASLIGFRVRPIVYGPRPDCAPVPEEFSELCCSPWPECVVACQ